ncbi:hypothetical protein CDIK_1837 [Cucumispora dikerogammari]|nr:hypothetical protein CDIK_1837 [Cucumispora dikerogammari]
MFCYRFFFSYNQIFCSNALSLKEIPETQSNLSNEETAQASLFEDSLFFQCTTSIITEVKTVLNSAIFQKIEAFQTSMLKSSLLDSKNTEQIEFFIAQITNIVSNVDFLTRLLSDFGDILLIKRYSFTLHLAISKLPELSESIKEKYLNVPFLLTVLKRDVLSFIISRMKNENSYYKSSVGVNSLVLENITKWYNKQMSSLEKVYSDIRKKESDLSS